MSTGPKRVGQRRECALDLKRFADIGDSMSETFGVRIEVSREALEARFFVDGGDLRALVEEQSAQALADPARGAGDDDHLVLECHAMFPKGRARDSACKAHPFSAPSMRPLKNSLCASVNAMMPGVTTMT